jgi:hypothetical protein
MGRTGIGKRRKLKAISDEEELARERLDALNAWLGDVYGERIQLDTLLIKGGLSESEIEQIKQQHLNTFLQEVLDLLETASSSLIRHRNHFVMVSHYGLADGDPKGFYVIGSQVGVCGERIRQLITQLMMLYRTPERQEQLQTDLATIARRLLVEA